MADDKMHAGSSDRDRISFGEDYDVRGWTESLGASEAEQREVVDAVGHSADAARAYRKKS